MNRVALTEELNKLVRCRKLYVEGWGQARYDAEVNALREQLNRVARPKHVKLTDKEVQAEIRARGRTLR